MDYVESILDLIGNTPMVRSDFLSQNNCDVFLKLEYYNPGGSVKDRTALGMIEQAEMQGLLKPGYQVIEASSGNMAIGLAMVCAAKGYKLTLVMRDDVSQARQKLLKMYGANLVLTPSELGLIGALSEAESLSLEMKHAYVPRQFDNIDNPGIHFRTTGPEIWEQMNHDIDIFISSIGSGGTIMGIGRYLKLQNPNIKIIAVEPEESAVISNERANEHLFSGMGASFVPKLIDKEIIDHIIKSPIADSVKIARAVAKHDKIMLGIAASSMLYAAMKVTKRCQNKRIVTMGAAHGERYAGSFLYDTCEVAEEELISFAQEI